ncbi:DUF4412 domain-containing protein [Mucilaginibacter sp.]|uniref:DUF4412 domain-containing protein n=1 Tax=Mucilaginibacter sp. TaxID=1882438 RepID=UPI0035BBE59D
MRKGARIAVEQNIDSYTLINSRYLRQYKAKWYATQRANDKGKSDEAPIPGGCTALLCCSIGYLVFMQLFHKKIIIDMKLRPIMLAVLIFAATFLNNTCLHAQRAGGPGKGTADFDKIIKSFMSARGGAGFWYQYVTTLESKEMGKRIDSSNSWFTNGGEARSEMSFPGVAGKSKAEKMILLARADQRLVSLALDENKKTYALNTIDSALVSAGISRYQVTKTGIESVGGYKSIHAKLLSSTEMGAFKSSVTTDVWTSTEVPGYALFKGRMVQNVTPAMMAALDKAGCGGFMVKIAVQSKNYSLTTILIKTVTQNFPASMFELPSGYRQSAD